MAQFCLTKQIKDSFKKGLKNGDIDPAKLHEMESVQRRNFLTKYVGKENAVRTNALFESKLLLKNQKAGYIAWAKKIAGISPEVKQDILTKIERLQTVLSPQAKKNFLQDLVNTRLGIDVTQKEAQTIADLSKKVSELKQKVGKNDKFANESDRLEYGQSKVAIEKYIDNLKIEAKSTKFIEQPTRKIVETVMESPGILKSIQSSFDNSFFGRQGIKVLYNNPGIWIKNFIKSWGDIGKQLKNIDAIDAIKADIYSRENSLNGKYAAGGYGLEVLTEEAYPSSLPSKIPLLGRLFKASEAAYNGAALRMRADLADKFIALAEKNGINTLNKADAKPIGDFIGSLTGRGKLGSLEQAGRQLNVLFYSVKFLKSNIDTLLAPISYASKKAGEKIGMGGFETKGAEFASRQAAKSTLRIVGTIASALAMAKFIDPESVDEDPRSTNFGKLKLFGHWVDITGGMGAIARLAARIVTGKSKTSAGKWTDLRQQGFGKRTVLDEIEDFFEGKLSPVAGLLRDYWKGELFGGETFTWEAALKNVTTPLPVQSAIELAKDPKSENVLASIILEGLGLSTSKTTTYKTDWEKSTSKELIDFKKEIGDKAFKKANEDYNRVYDWWYSDVSQKEAFKKLSEEAKQKLITKNKAKIKKMIFEANDFKYEKQEADEEETEVIKELSIE